LNSITDGSSNTLAGTNTTFNVNQGTFGATTVGSNTYLLGNAGGTANAVSKTKWATYKIKRLPKIGLTVGDSYSLNLIAGGYVSPGLPASFGQAAAIVSSDPTKVTAAWADASTITISLISSASSPVNVDVTAAPSATAPFGADVDVERIVVATNLLANGTFATAADTSAYGFEAAPGRTTQVTPTINASLPDVAGTSASGVATFTFADANGGSKFTPFAANRIPYTAGQWYIVRARLFANAGNSHQILLFNFNNEAVVGARVDVGASVLFGIPSTWSWLETPVLTFGAGTGYPQVQLKASAAGSINIDELQVINSSPILADASRGATNLRYVYGDFNIASDTTGYGDEGYPFGVGQQTIRPTNTVGTSLHMDFSGAGPSASQKGLKWTANNAVGGTVYTPAAVVGNQVGVKASINKGASTFNDLSDIILLAIFGVQTNGSLTIASTPSNLIASAEFGGLTNGTHYAIGAATNPFYQFQFGVKTAQAGIIDLDGFDFISANDDPPFGDGTLYP
jgi:hypothetical protein